MAGIKLYRSNSIEELSRALAKNLKSPLSSTLASEIILVQSLGMAKWLSLEMANRLGVWANSNFIFPNSFVNRLFSIVLPNVEEKRFLDRELMTWIIFNCLTNIDQIDFDDIFAHLTNYCKGEDSNFRAFQLARQLAVTYDQYLLYRPDFIYLWESFNIKDGKNIKNSNFFKIDETKNHKTLGWQGILWREICKREGITNKVAQKKEFMEALRNYRQTEMDKLPKRLPERVSVFGISSLPIFHLDILSSISEFIEISFYVMTPAQGYFSDLKSAKAKMKHENIGTYMGISPDLLHIETGNPLLASLGKAGADFMENLLNYDNLEDIDLKFIEPTGDTILAMVQQDILLMRDRGSMSKTHLSIDEVSKDRSIVINSCHSPMREVEVLNDYLLELFDSNPNITPADVLVMTPNIEVYAPFVRAVFTTPEEPRLKIPFSIADLSIKTVSRSVDVFMQILSLPERRFEAPFIIDILECDDVARRFNLEPRDMDLIRDWIKESAIRWGKDGKYRESIGLPSFEENSWRAGLDRLMAGYAMIGQDDSFFQKKVFDDKISSINGELKNDIKIINILPCDCVEGNSSKILGSFSRFFNTLSKTADKIATKMTLSEWGDFLMSVVDDFFLPDADNTSMIQGIRDTLSELKNTELITGFTTKIDSRVIKNWCDKAIGKDYHDSKFLNGGVTFCAMLPMRTIPAKVISIIGLNDAIFPRIDNPPNFDLIKQNPRRGDRSLRNEDRYLFLETIISAREQLYLSYIGQGIEDNSIIPPSVVISELMDYLDRSFIVKKDSANYDNPTFNSTKINHSITKNCLSKENSSEEEALQKGDKLEKAPLNLKPLSSYIVTRHKLQPFSPAYFEQNSEIFSYSKSNFFAASALLKRKNPIKPFISGQIVNKPDKSSSLKGESCGYYAMIALNNLLKFFSSPQKYFLENRLGIYLKEYGEKLDDCEPFNLDYLDTYKLKDEMLNKMIRNNEVKVVQTDINKTLSSLVSRAGIGQNNHDNTGINIYRAKGLIPHGTAGIIFYKENQTIVRAFYRKIGEYIEFRRSNSLEVDIIYNSYCNDYDNSSNGWRLKGTISDIWGDKIVRFRVASVKAKDILKAWIIHLASACRQLSLITNLKNLEVDTDDNDITMQSQSTFLIGKDKVYQFKIPNDPITILDDLIKIYKHGLTEPIHFFPESSKSYAEAIFKVSDDQYKAENKGMEKACSEFEGGYYKSGEKESDDIKLCFRDIETPLDDKFRFISTTVWIPILEHLDAI